MKKPPNRWNSRYPLLYQFFRGYLHQDFPDEYGSVTAALRQYRKDAGEHEFARFAIEWDALLTETAEFSPAELDRIFTEELGGSWHVGSRRELAAFSEAVKKSA